MIGIYAYRLDAVTLPPPRGYPSQPLLRTISRFSPAVTALPADFRPLSLAAGHCGYCPLSLLPSQCPGRCTCIFTCTAATTRSPTSPSILACYQIPVLRLLLFRVPGHLLCAVCAGMCLLSALCSLFFSTLSTTHPPIPHSSLFFCPAALYPFRHPLSPSASASQMLHFWFDIRSVFAWRATALSLASYNYNNHMPPDMYAIYRIPYTICQLPVARWRPPYVAGSLRAATSKSPRRVLRKLNNIRPGGTATMHFIPALSRSTAPATSCEGKVKREMRKSRQVYAVGKFMESRFAGWYCQSDYLRGESEEVLVIWKRNIYYNQIKLLFN